MIEKLAKIQVAMLGLILGLCLIIGASVLSSNFKKNEITVTGSAYEIVKSDSASWKVQVSTKAPTSVEAYNKLKSQVPAVVDFLVQSGIKKEQISLMGINNYPTYRRDAKGNFTQDVAFYNYDQILKITSDNPDLINKVYLEIPSLIQKGITLQAFAPEYHYSELNKKKAELLKAATADAKVRAEGMLKATNNRVGKISSVKMGVMQITPADSNEVSDWGINDSSTIDKKITAVANVVFSVKSLFGFIQLKRGFCPVFWWNKLLHNSVRLNTTLLSCATCFSIFSMLNKVNVLPNTKQQDPETSSG